ncbi:MAG TPA: phosphohistidine phosphatase SixA [Acidiferrobacterales bacterium]|nr:phosphohistidine phosphatase SixA [Acidiferrobacterales bacterium]
MQLVLIRHARAEERALFKRDRTRALTADGRRRMRKAARGLHGLIPGISQIATSPLVRARQTAEIVATAGNSPEVMSLPVLAPGGDVRVVLAWLRAQPSDATLVLVGHEPDLGLLAGWLLSGKQTGFVQFKKGAAALIEFAGAPAAGKGKLAWMLTAAQLSEIG